MLNSLCVCWEPDLWPHVEWTAWNETVPLAWPLAFPCRLRAGQTLLEFVTTL